MTRAGPTDQQNAAPARKPPANGSAERASARGLQDPGFASGQPNAGTQSSAGGWPAQAKQTGLPAAPRATTAGVSAQGAARVAIRTSRHDAAEPARAMAKQAGRPDAPPWYQASHSGRAASGLRHCGPLENLLFREWAADQEPPGESVMAVTRLAELPQLIKEKLAAGLRAIHVGAGGVPDLDHMGSLKGVPLPSGLATWDACAGAYGDRKIIVGTRPSPTPDVMCHEVGHALDDIDGANGRWQSDSPEFSSLYEGCLPRLASESHRHLAELGRREFFADAFAAIASSQRPALVEMLSGDTRAALDVMLYFNVHYGI